MAKFYLQPASVAIRGSQRFVWTEDGIWGIVRDKRGDMVKSQRLGRRGRILKSVSFLGHPRESAVCANGGWKLGNCYEEAGGFLNDRNLGGGGQILESASFRGEPSAYVFFLVEDGSWETVRKRRGDRA